MKPHGPGTVWFARDRRIAVVDHHSQTPVRILEPGGISLTPYALADPYLSGEWVQVDRPKFPELPPKPALVLFTQAGWGQNAKYWGYVDGDTVYTIFPKSGHGATYNLQYAKIVVVPHPDNDPSAVAMIEGRA